MTKEKQPSAGSLQIHRGAIESTEMGHVGSRKMPYHTDRTRAFGFAQRLTAQHQSRFDDPRGYFSLRTPLKGCLLLSINLPDCVSLLTY